MKHPIALLLAVALVLATGANGADLTRSEPIEVDVQLVLAADISGSMSARLRNAQRQGFAAAFRDEALQRVIKSGPLGRIAVTYFEWAGKDSQQVIVPWTILGAPEDMTRFAGMLEASTVESKDGGTSISGAMMFARQLFDESTFVSYRKVVDISGNGKNSQGPDLGVALTALRERGAIVNGLVLPDFSSDPADPYSSLFADHRERLIDYYRKNVITGAGAFAMEVYPNEDFTMAILRKLAMEIAWVGVGEI